MTERKEIICSELSEQLEGISTHASMLCSRTHDRAEVERNMDEILQLVDKLVEVAQGAKMNFHEWRQLTTK